ncbi:MAG: hypothetical protein H6744_04435 [Deltaproteobacteria bacterium]|nr:hypothetical protein [Deltaproteobacteria bacterium]MCB9785922.1 hypothetical protein [Deltaproteobacteria bacterium]
MTGKRALILWAILASLPASGCKYVGDKHSGDDATRGGATPVELDVAVDDRLSQKQGDNTDWKTFSLDAPAEVTVDIWWDDPSIKGSVTLRDQFGARLSGVSHAQGTRHEVIGPLLVPAGQSFVEVFLSRGASVYTLEVRAKASASVPSAPVRPDF